jgi:predicted transposase YdaD
VEVCQQALEGLVDLEPGTDKRIKYSEFVTQYARLNRADKAELQRRLAQSRYREATMGIILDAREEGRQEGLQQGIQRGRQEGRQEGLREGLLDTIQFALELKFGEAGLALLAEIGTIEDLSLLRTIKDALRLAESLDEIRILYQNYRPSH